MDGEEDKGLECYIRLHGLSAVLLLRQVLVDFRARAILIPVPFRSVIYEAVLLPHLAVPDDGFPQRRVREPCRRIIEGKAAVEKLDQLLYVCGALQLGAPG